jgi:hypothetical protein
MNEPTELKPCPFCHAPAEPFDGDFVVKHKEGCYIRFVGHVETWLSPTAIAKSKMWNTRAPIAQAQGWLNLKTTTPPLLDAHGATKPYVLAVDSKGRMTVAYAYQHPTGEIEWIMAKPVGVVTHWMPLPQPPK